jgi:hypothetical protein
MISGYSMPSCRGYPALPAKPKGCRFITIARFERRITHLRSISSQETRFMRHNATSSIRFNGDPIHVEIIFMPSFFWSA